MPRELPDTQTADLQSRDLCSSKLVDGELTGLIIKCFYFTYNVLGYGFLEAVYRRALAAELRSRGLHVLEEYAAAVRYFDHPVGYYRIDLFVERRVCVELKATSILGPTDKRQLMNVLKAGSMDVGLLLHYGPKPEFHRVANPRVVRG